MSEQIKSGIFWYKKGWNHCLELLKEMTKDTEYESWDSMIQELEERFEEKSRVLESEKK